MTRVSTAGRKTPAEAATASDPATVSAWAAVLAARAPTTLVGGTQCPAARDGGATSLTGGQVRALVRGDSELVYDGVALDSSCSPALLGGPRTWAKQLGEVATAAGGRAVSPGHIPPVANAKHDEALRAVGHAFSRSVRHMKDRAHLAIGGGSR
jgi:hypothetical protein